MFVSKAFLCSRNRTLLIKHNKQASAYFSDYLLHIVVMFQLNDFLENQREILILFSVVLNISLTV